jgi:hypothetical protein
MRWNILVLAPFAVPTIVTAAGGVELISGTGPVSEGAMVDGGALTRAEPCLSDAWRVVSRVERCG